ncbi:MAG: hypothetical protein H8D23_34705 [Candidatus Brocadiales bacterium]|nr:hypothetical protein [Candidatus Brocadiales bacterium]
MTTKIKFANFKSYNSANILDNVMYLFKSKQKLKKLSILLLAPYILLCITAGGFHAFDKSSFHGHSVDKAHSENTVLNADTADNGSPFFCYNDHSEDDCIVCKWLKHAPKRVQLSMDISSFIPDTSGLCINKLQTYYFLNTGKYQSRAPPLFIS